MTTSKGNNYYRTNRSYLSTVNEVLILLLLLMLLSVGESSMEQRCPMDCITSRNGICRGYAGADCKFPYEICPDAVTQCYGPLSMCGTPRTIMTAATTTNSQSVTATEDEGSKSVFARSWKPYGSKLDDEDKVVTVEELYHGGDDQKLSQYSCQCAIVVTATSASSTSSSSSTTEMIRAAQFEDCKDQNRVTEVCEAGQVVSTYAFCLNGGKCVAQVPTGNMHPGCVCTGLTEGQFCEKHRKMTPEYEPAPKEDFEWSDSYYGKSVSETETTLQENMDNLIPSVHLWILVVIFSILSAVIMVIIGYGCFYGMCRRTRCRTRSSNTGYYWYSTNTRSNTNTTRNRCVQEESYNSEEDDIYFHPWNLIEETKKRKMIVGRKTRKKCNTVETIMWTTTMNILEEEITIDTTKTVS